MAGRKKKDCSLWVGTSGYSYVEWIDAGFYPPGTKSAHMLPHYVNAFPTVELNFTWYQMPKAQVLERMRVQVSPAFRFAVKLTRTLTHEVAPDQWQDQVRQYRDGIAPLLQARQLAAVLVQLAPYFDRTRSHRRYLAELLDELAGLPVAIEFRHRSWAKDRVFTELEERRVTLVAVDAPDLPNLFPRLDVVTNPDFFYIRFHGRNTQGWRSGNMQKKFDYHYSAAELAGWTDDRTLAMGTQAQTGYFFFNNHVRGQATENARQLMGQLTGRGAAVVSKLPEK